MYSSFPVFQRAGGAAYKNDLNNTLYIDDYLKNPHKNFKSIHIAGTNGKGSVAHTLASILQEAGYKTALYTSPHLKDFRERIKINGQMIDQEYVVRFINDLKPVIEKIQPSFFEMTVAMAFSYFLEKKVDVAVIEVGMGGRLDSTNVIAPLLSVITNIGLDHVQFLGNSIEKIAVEKAGIIKHRVPVVVGLKQPETERTFKESALNNKTEIFYATDGYSIIESDCDNELMRNYNVFRNGEILFENVETDLKGSYQAENIATVLTSVDELKKQGFNIADVHLKAGLLKVSKNTGLSGRWQILKRKPLVICDTGHNEDGIRLVVRQLKKYASKKLHIVFGTVNDKEVGKILSLLPGSAIYYFTKADIPRALDEKDLMNEAQKYGLKGKAFGSVEMAYNKALERAGADDMIFIGGSTFVVAEVL